MKRVSAFLGVIVLAAAGTAAPALGGEFRIENRTFNVPDGLRIELVAGPPLVDRPITADLDEKGRLYVADSSGSNDKVQIQLEQRPHRILRLEDTDGDGKYDKRTVFADKMMFPEGTMWHDGSLYVSAPPSIWKLTDTNDDGVADVRVEWYQGKTLTGCANDLHGPYRGPDGLIYWAKGAFAEQTHPRPGKPPLVTKASHIFRAAADASGIESVMAGGMDNPVDVTFSPAGERFFTTTFLQHPEGGKRDGIIHAVYGGVYGKVHAVIDNHPRTRPEMMPTLVHLGPAAPCGLTRYESTVLGEKYRDNLFACQFNLRKVSRHVLIPDGATFKTEDSELVSSPDQDFHPTDVIEDFDGSVLVVDTGGWYKLCCPTSQLSKPDILGGIYRIKPTWLDAKHDASALFASLEKADTATLVSKLNDTNPSIRRRASDLLAKREGVAEQLKLAGSPQARLAAVWLASRLNGDAARAFAREGLHDKDALVRQAACHAVAVRRDAKAIPVLGRLVVEDTPAIRRAAAEALGRIGDAGTVPTILKSLETADDRTLEHSLTFAMIEIGDASAIAPGLDSGNERTRRGALIALDQLGDKRATARLAGAALASRDKVTRDAGGWLISRHPEWGSELVGILRSRLESMDKLGPDADELADQLGGLANSGLIQTLLAEQAGEAASKPIPRRVALDAMRRSTLKSTPAAWVVALTNVLRDANDVETLDAAVLTTRSLPTVAPGKDREGLSKALLQRFAKVGEDRRVAILAAVPGGLNPVEPEHLKFLLSRLSSELPVAERLLAAETLARAKLSSADLVAATEVLKTAGPLEVDKLLAAYETSRDETVGLKLVEALSASSAKGSLRADALKTRLAKYPPRVQAAAQPLIDGLNLDAAKQKEKLEQMLARIKEGDVRRGQLVFNGTKAACRACHSSGYVGGKVGPDLTRVGGTRNERDLLEAILFPSVSFVRSYEPVVIETKDGKTYGGIVKKDGPDEVVLAVNATEEAHIPRGSIEEMRPGTVSVMPAGLDQQLSVQELADLVAFLKNSR